MKWLRFWTLLLMLSVARDAAAQQPSADTIISRCLAGYDALKTYHGRVEAHITRGDARQSFTLTVTAAGDGHGLIKTSVMSVNSSSTGPKGSTSSRLRTVDTGDAVYMINDELKQYGKTAHGSDRISGLFRRTLTNVQRMAPKLRVRVVQSKGAPVYDLWYSNKQRTCSILISREGYRLLRVSGGVTEGPDTFSSEFKAVDQEYNVPAQESEFRWTPPADFKEVPAKAIGSVFGK